MTEIDPRPLPARLDAHIANLESIEQQLTEIADLVEESDGYAVPVRDAARLYSLIRSDLTQVVNGEKLREFRIEGQI